jgi:hypothetical protein
MQLINVQGTVQLVASPHASTAVKVTVVLPQISVPGGMLCEIVALLPSALVACTPVVTSGMKPQPLQAMQMSMLVGQEMMTGGLVT